MNNLMSKPIKSLPEDCRTASAPVLLRICCVLAFAAAPALSSAQAPDLNLMNPETIGGPQPYSSVSTDTETVNNANGNLIVNVPLLHLPGINGLDLDLSLRFESKGPHVVDNSYTSWGPNDQQVGTGLATFGNPTVNFNPQWSGPFTDQDFAGGYLSIPRLSVAGSNYSYVTSGHDISDLSCQVR